LEDGEYWEVCGFLVEIGKFFRLFSKLAVAFQGRLPWAFIREVFAFSNSSRFRKRVSVVDVFFNKRSAFSILFSFKKRGSSNMRAVSRLESFL
jgi:hypothetical protein